MDYDQYRPASPFDTLLVPIHVLPGHFNLILSPVKNDGWLLWQANRNKEQQNSAGHCSNHLFVNSGHGL
jgi:hypothetical protein